MKWIRCRAVYLRSAHAGRGVCCLFTCLLVSPSTIPTHAAGFLLATTPAPPGPSQDALTGAWATLLAALLGAVVAGLFGFFFLKYQMGKTRELERENRRMQALLEGRSQEQQFEDDLGKSRYEAWQAARRDEQERERERRKSTQNAARSIMAQARTSAERAEAYRQAIHADPNIAQLQILDMAHPLEVDKVYVRVSLYQESRHPAYTMDAALLDAAHDPNKLLKARLSLLEMRTREAMTPEEAVQKYPRCVVLGDPGAGKSTLLKYLTLQAVDGHLPKLPHLPIHIVLGEFAASTSSDLLSFVARRWDEWYGFPEDEAQNYIKNCLSDGSALLLLDALDETVLGGSETAARESYSRVVTAINQVATRYPRAPIVVTARKAGYAQRAHLSGFTELEVLDFRPTEIQAFVENWFLYHPTPPKYATAADLNAQLNQNPRVQSLAANPLLLCLIILVYESLQDLPEQRADIYKQCVDVLLSKWDTSRDIRRRKKFRPEHKQSLLIEIAWHFHTRGQRYFPEDELLTVIANFLPSIGCAVEESRAILREIEEENGLLKEQAHGWHGFLHLTLQEYFVALYLSQVKNGQKLLLKHYDDPWWEEITLLYVGSVRDASSLLQALLKRERWRWPKQDNNHTPLFWAGRCLAAKPRIARRKIRDKIVTRLFRVLRKESHSLFRDDDNAILAGEILLKIEGSDAREKLFVLLKDKQGNKGVRNAIIYALGRLGDKTMIPDLLVLLKDKQNNEVIRGAIIHALGSLGDKSVISDLLALLKDKKNNENICGSTIIALVTLEDKAVVPDLLPLLIDKQDNFYVRGTIEYALGILGDKTVIPALLLLLKDKQNNKEARRTIVNVLGKLGDKAVIPDLLLVLKDKQDDEYMRRTIANVLGRLGDKAVIPDLLLVLKDKQDDEYMRRTIANALGNSADKTVIPDLLLVLKDKQDNKDVRKAIVRALEKLGDKSVIPGLLMLLKDKRDNKDVRKTIKDVLKNFN